MKLMTTWFTTTGQVGCLDEMIVLALWVQLQFRSPNETTPLTRVVITIKKKIWKYPRPNRLFDIVFCKLCSVGELNERLNCKSMEIKWYIYTKVDP